MKYVKLLSRPSPPGTAISILEKQAMTEMIERNVAQLAVILNFFSGFKEYGR